MKTYNFTVEVEGIRSNESSLINSFINIANDEQNQYKITEAINKESTKIYNKILCDFVEKINIELSIAHIKGFNTPNYSNLEFVQEEIEESKKLFNKYKWPVVDVTRKSVEETAATIIKIFDIKKKGKK